jgi:hypothetical protein
METVVQNLTVVIGGVIVAIGTTVLNNFKQKKLSYKCPQEKCKDHESIAQHITEMATDIKWIVASLTEKK